VPLGAWGSTPLSRAAWSWTLPTAGGRPPYAVAMGRSKANPGEADRIAAVFAEAFSAWGLELPEGAVERSEPVSIHGAG